MNHGKAIPSLWLWCLFPAITMSLGWGLRGYIRGGPLGAMIPGAMIGLAICLLLRREADSAFVAAFAAVGVGFGGQETYGQTVHIATVAETWAWGITGFALKGAIWGLLGGAAIGIALTRERYRPVQLISGLLLMVAGTYTGWKLVNQPKLIYFSNRLDKPREDVWAGLLLGGLVLLAWLSWRAGARLPWRFALWGALGGGVGFSLGAAIQVWGRLHAPQSPFEWWKAMEFTFGALLGLSYGYCAWRHRAELTPPETNGAPRQGLVDSQVCASLALAIGIQTEDHVPSEFDYTIIGAVLLSVAFLSRAFSWQTAITVTYCAFALDFVKNRSDLPAPALWAFLIVTTGATAIYAARRAAMRPLFRFLILSSVLVALGKGLLLRPAGVQWRLVVIELTFVALAALALLLTPGPEPGEPAPPIPG